MEDSLKKIKESEARAEEMMQDAETRAAEIVEDAKVKARGMKEDTLQKIKTRSREAVAVARADSDRRLEDAARQSERETAALRELVAQKRTKAVEELISLLV
ncbi:MAG: hypothetical protein LUE24_01040 [Lachnospiraceae bacterium]|nr:hypothetical protein [Lachnospiraceae bacterium]